MSVRDLIPWGRSNGNQVPSLFRDGERDPFLSLHREVNRLFDEAFRHFNMPSLFGQMPGWPSVEVSETDKDLCVTVELPGLDQKDVEVLMSDGMLLVRGEKKAEIDDKERQFSERFYGRFERQIPLGSEVEEDRIDASFKNGVLKIILPKTAKAQASSRRIQINGAKAD